MALTLAEAAKLETDYLRRGVIETFGEYSPVLEDLPFMDVQGNSYRYNLEDTLPDVEFRAVNSSYTESTGTVTDASESLVIFGGVVDVDRYLQQVRGSINDLRALQTRLKVKSLALAFTREFFEGDSSVDANSFDGLQKRLTGDKVITADDGSGNGDALSLAYVDQLIDTVWGGPDVLYMNKANRRKLVQLARETELIVVEMDRANKIHTYYDGIPVKVVDKDNNDDDILGFDETVGTETECSSIYAARFGADEFISGLSNGGIQVEDLGLIANPPVYRTLIEWYVGLALFNPKSAARLRGIHQ
ncbi:MAG: phage major capsid protein [Chloroflexi bacterium]|nr:MAG: phage major capsid protein [Chloroflexota bacterium]